VITELRPVLGFVALDLPGADINWGGLAWCRTAKLIARYSPEAWQWPTLAGPPAEPDVGNYGGDAPRGHRPRSRTWSRGLPAGGAAETALRRVTEPVGARRGPQV
jgi:hypothetical protein